MNSYVATQPSTTPTTLKGRLLRMTGLYALKPWFTRLLTPVVDTAVTRRISPDAFTVAGVAAAGAAGVAVAFGYWPLAAVFMVLRLAGANLDGAVARARGVSRPWGFVVNEIGDRTSDLFAFGGLAVWAARQDGPGFHWLSWTVIQVLVAALAATLPTFASLAGAAAGATRRNGGPLGKTERCLLVVLASAFPVVMPVLLMQLVNGSLITTFVRLRAAHREVREAKTQRLQRVSLQRERPELAQQRVVLVEHFDAATQPMSAATRPLNVATRPAELATVPMRRVAA